MKTGGDLCRVFQLVFLWHLHLDCSVYRIHLHTSSYVSDTTFYWPPLWLPCKWFWNLASLQLNWEASPADNIDHGNLMMMRSIWVTTKRTTHPDDHLHILPSLTLLHPWFSLPLTVLLGAPWSTWNPTLKMRLSWPKPDLSKNLNSSLKLKLRFLCSCLATTWMSHLNSLPVLLLLCTYLGSRGWMSDLHSPQAEQWWLLLCNAVPAGRYSSDNSCFHSRLPPRLLLLLLLLLRHKPFLSTTAQPLLSTSWCLWIWWWKVSDSQCPQWEIHLWTLE